MNRRSLLKGVTLLGLGSTIPMAVAKAAAPVRHTPKAYKRFNIGSLEISIITDGSLRMQPVQPNFAPGADAQVVKEMLEERFRPTDYVPLALNVTVIKKGNRLVLIDTGTGGSESTSGWLVDSLRNAGVNPAAVTDIVITHAHPDHIGGLVDANFKPVFPKATVHMAAIEYNFWAGTPDMSKSGLVGMPVLKDILAQIKRTLTVVKPQLRLFNQQETLFGFIRFVAAPGHTPGLSLVEIFDGEESLLNIADLIHSDVLQFPHPEWGFMGDTDLQLASATRRKVLSDLADTRKRILGYHLPWPGLGHVRKSGEGFEWVAESFVTP